MPRASPYRIDLTDEERRHLEAAARRYTSPYSDVMRSKIVLYAAAGLGNDEIATPPGHPAPGRVEVAQALLRASPRRTA